MKYLLAFTTLTLLSGCASAIDGQTQDVTVLTPGAENARCYLQNEDFKYVIHTDETISIMKSPHDLEVHCLAAGNREKTIIVKREVNDWVAGNVATGVVPGVAYDYFSRGGFEYPEIITVDFTGMAVKKYDPPDYHNDDLRHNQIYNRVEFMGPSEMVTEQNRYQDIPALKKRENQYGQSEKQVDAGAFETMLDDIHSKYNPQVNYNPSEEDK